MGRDGLAAACQEGCDRGDCEGQDGCAAWDEPDVACEQEGKGEGGCVRFSLSFV